MDGAVVDWLAHLLKTVGINGSIVLVEGKATLVPRQSKEVNQLSAPTLLVGNQSLIGYLENRVWQYSLPVFHEPLVIVSVEASQCFQVISKAIVRTEIVKVAR